MTALWKPMLAAKPDPAELDTELAKLPYPALFSPKLDGIRAMVQNGTLYSRSLKPIPNLAMQKLWGRKELDWLDGEIIVGPPTAEHVFNCTTSVVMARNKPADDAAFYVFDKYSLGGFEARLQQAAITQQLFRYSILLVPHVPIGTAKQLAAYEAKMLAKGYEGIMRRSFIGAYKHGRSTLKEGGLIAVKRTVDAEAVILAVYEQEENTNEQKVNELGRLKRSAHKAGKRGKGTLGGFTVSMYQSPKKNDVVFNIGTGVGLTDAVRAELWERRKALVGKVIKFRYQGIGTMNAPRQPIFLGFRAKEDM